MLKMGILCLLRFQELKLTGISIDLISDFVRNHPVLPTYTTIDFVPASYPTVNLDSLVEANLDLGLLFCR
ncbi:predicted protein [Arabidopsis lyrata subsp. lyrata]|uniref:Predicted protein n=1 Tax=Arabidopsis lyrata subsp. lyrata TaxID=81972 RepID=D7LWH4_ARALL|nr:predicted protein [Arabidopsis lyrata subsp. lyrata]